MILSAEVGRWKREERAPGHEADCNVTRCVGGGLKPIQEISKLAWYY